MADETPRSAQHAPITPSRRHRPIYQAGDDAFEIDSCLPQEEAIARGRIRLRGLSHGNYPGRALEPEDLPGLSSIGRWTTIGRQDWGVEPHRNEGVEICFLTDGRMHFHLDGVDHDLRPGAVTITSPWQLHHLGNPWIPSSDLVWMIIDVGVRRPDQAWTWPPWVLLSRVDRDELARRLRSGQGPVQQAGPDLARIFRELGQLLEGIEGEPRLSLLAIVLNRILLGLLDQLRQEPEPRQDAEGYRLATVRLFLDDLRLNDVSLGQEWSVQTMARACGLGTTAFTEVVHACTGRTPMAWLRQCRLERAAELLRSEPGRGVTDIALACGFTSSQYFATAFRAFFRQTPRDYRVGA